MLVVEDTTGTSEPSRPKTLQELGYGTHWVADADEALATLAAKPDTYDVVFSDVVMAGHERGRARARGPAVVSRPAGGAYQRLQPCPRQESDHGFEPCRSRTRSRRCRASSAAPPRSPGDAGRRRNSRAGKTRRWTIPTNRPGTATFRRPGVWHRRLSNPPRTG